MNVVEHKEKWLRTQSWPNIQARKYHQVFSNWDKNKTKYPQVIFLIRIWIVKTQIGIFNEGNHRT